MSEGVFDVAVIGAGAAGMMAAAVAGQRGLRVVLIDHAAKLGEKIRISGGGRCNFTNIGTTPVNFLSQSPNFCRSALSAYTPKDFIALVNKYGIAWHEKHRGQLFCDDSSESIINLLKRECDKGKVAWRMPCSVEAISHEQTLFTLRTSLGVLKTRQLVMACGGMAIPQLGASDFALKVARQFGLKVVEPRPALVPLTFDAEHWKPFGALSGVALQVAVSCGAGKKKTEFTEDLLFTHRGLSGPAILQISSFWNPGQAITLDLAPTLNLESDLLNAKQGNRQQLSTVLSAMWPKRLADQWLANNSEPGLDLGALRMADVSDKALRRVAQQIHGWDLVPTGTMGYKKAEVMRGGVDTDEINQKTMQTKKQPGLYFIGEALDVTGWLGGYNFQWAWASGVACARSLQSGGY